jgi:nicotinamidase-related amidase
MPRRPSEFIRQETIVYTQTAPADTLPKTLLALAGVARAMPRLDDSAIVVIDAQREYVDGRLPLAGVGAAIDEIGRLLGRARAARAPILHVVHNGAGLFAPGTAGVGIIAAADPAPGEPVLVKKLPNAFASTDLATRLAALKRPTTVLVGFMTHMCVEATARAAIDLGLKAAVVAAATATRDLPDAFGRGVIPAVEVQRNALAAIGDRFATIVPREADIA